MGWKKKNIVRFVEIVPESTKSYQPDMNTSKGYQKGSTELSKKEIRIQIEGWNKRRDTNTNEILDKKEKVIALKALMNKLESENTVLEKQIKIAEQSLLDDSISHF